MDVKYPYSVTIKLIEFVHCKYAISIISVFNFTFICPNIRCVFPRDVLISILLLFGLYSLRIEIETELLSIMFLSAFTLTCEQSRDSVSLSFVPKGYFNDICLRFKIKLKLV
jgi:hypothetical protein